MCCVLASVSTFKFILDMTSHSLDQEQDPSHLKNILADIGPPEFIPGKKWAGFRPIDPESDPDITPGSVAIAKTMSVNTVKDVDQVKSCFMLVLLYVPIF